MTEIFLSHSKDDGVLIDHIKRTLTQVGCDTIIFEEEEVKDYETDDEAIRRLMRSCNACFVFPLKMPVPTI